MKFSIQVCLILTFTSSKNFKTIQSSVSEYGGHDTNFLEIFLELSWVHAHDYILFINWNYTSNAVTKLILINSIKLDVKRQIIFQHVNLSSGETLMYTETSWRNNDSVTHDYDTRNAYNIETRTTYYNNTNDFYYKLLQYSQLL